MSRSMDLQVKLPGTHFEARPRAPQELTRLGGGLGEFGSRITSGILKEALGNSPRTPEASLRLPKAPQLSR